MSTFVRSAVTNSSSVVEQGKGEVLSAHQHAMKATCVKPELTHPSIGLLGW